MINLKTHKSISSLTTSHI